jgi:hypothetical protein
MPKAAAALLAVVLMSATAVAEGERGPMFGGSVVAAHDDHADVTGVGAELVYWSGGLGIAAEGARRWSIDGDGPPVGSFAASLRMLAFDHIVPSLLDARDQVSLGIELQLVGERAWWDELSHHRDSYGFGVAVRVRGAGDDDGDSLLAESRLFVRVMKAHDNAMDVIAREVSPSRADSAVSVVVGLGVLFGGGRLGYVYQLRRRSQLDAESILGRPGSIP